MQGRREQGLTTGNNASRAAELLQNGIRLFREGRAPEAYGMFREVVNYDPNNEFGWIWLSVTSQDYGEKRAALERALQINPNSAHAREALRALNAEAPAPEVAATPPTYQDRPTDQMRPVAPPANNGPRRGLRDRIGDRTVAPADDLAQNLRQAPPAKKTGKAAPPPGQLVSTTTAGQNFARSVRVGALVLLAIIVIALVAYFLFSKFSNNSAPPPVAGNTTTVAATTQAATTPSVTTTQAVTTVAADTPTVPVALIVSPTPPTGVNSVGTTTSAATTTTVAGTATSVSGQVDNLLSSAQTSLSSGDYKTALQSYKQALQLDPSNVQTNFRLGLLYLSAPISQLNTTSPYDSAISAFKVVTNQDPTWAGGFAQLGAAYAAKGDLQDAIQAYRTSLDLDPNGPERWLELASLYDRTNQSALASYARTRAQSSNQNPAVSTTTNAENGSATTVAATTEAATATPVPPTPTPKPTATPTPAVPTPTFTPVLAAPPSTPK